MFWVNKEFWKKHSRRVVFNGADIYTNHNHIALEKLRNKMFITREEAINLFKLIANSTESSVTRNGWIVLGNGYVAKMYMYGRGIVIRINKDGEEIAFTLDNCFYTHAEVKSEEYVKQLSQQFI